MTDIDCPRKCCNARYCPLILAWATTIHKFQGFEAGFGKHDAIKHIIADINTLKWEKNHPGTAYVVASRAKTIGRATVETPYPRKSNLFFTGTLGNQRFTKCLYKENGEKCLAVKKRDLWVNYLSQRVAETKARRSEEAMRESTDFVIESLNRSTIKSKRDLQKRIIDIIHSPNETWKENKKQFYST